MSATAESARQVSRPVSRVVRMRRSPVGRFLSSRGPGMHHVAYAVDDVEAALTALVQAGAELIDEAPRTGLFGLEVAFVHPDAVHGVLTEVVCPA